MPKDVFSLYTDETIRNVIKYAYANHLGSSYKPGNLEETPLNIGGITVNRPSFGLAHTVRTMAYAEMMVEEAHKAQLRGETLQKFSDGRTLADVTPNELKKIMIAQSFFVAGKGHDSDPENQKYHALSRKAFLDYVEANKSSLIPQVFKDPSEVSFYADVIEAKDPNNIATPAHLLINQSHMIDSLRVKQPAESFMEHYFSELQPWVGSKGTEAVFAKQRQFLHATYEVVTGFDSNNTEAHLVVPGLGRYVIAEDGNPIREMPSKSGMLGHLKFFPQDYKLQGNERFMRVDEYLKLDEVQHVFPAVGKKLEGGIPGLNEFQYLQRLSSRERGLCETNVDFCLGQLQTANHQAKIEPLKEALQTPLDKGRRTANADEIAAARIIQQIMANPADSIHEQYVLLNGTKLEEQFFRDLLAKCDMAIVGSLLNDTDIRNIDKFMQHEKNTEFHSTDPLAVPVKLGQTWQNVIRQGGKSVPDIEQDLIYLMQNDAWYYSRVNAIAQNRDKNSTFKEVLITTLMTPLTSKSLADTSRATPPRTLFRGLNLSEDFKNKLIHQSETIIANNTEHLFTNPSTESFKQIKLNDFSQMSANTCISTSSNIEVPRMFDSNTIFEMLDPDGLLQPKQVGRHEVGSESEFSIYLPEDVALIPIKVANDDNTVSGKECHIITFVAVKSPDFIPRIESGYAAEPFVAMQSSQLNKIKEDIEMQIVDLFLLDPYDKTISLLEQQIALPVRGFWDRASHLLSSDKDGKISSELKEVYKSTILPIVKECRTAVEENNLNKMQNALAKFPSEKEWAQLSATDASVVKATVDELRNNLQKKIILQSKVWPHLESCKQALDAQDIPKALASLQQLPSDKEMEAIGALKLKSMKHAVTANLASLQHAAITPMITDPEKIKIRYGELFTEASQQIETLEKKEVKELSDVNNMLLNLDACTNTLGLLHSEKTNHGDSLDLSDPSPLKDRAQIITQNLITNVMEMARTNLQQMKAPSTFHIHEAQVKECLNVLTTLEKAGKVGAREQQKIEELKSSLVEQQKNHATMLPLQSKSKSLITQLQQISIRHQGELREHRNTQLNHSGMDKQQQLEVRFREQVSARFKSEFNNDNAEASDLIAFLEKKRPTELEIGLGISDECANELHNLLKVLIQTPSATQEIAEQMEAINKLSKAIGDAPVKLESVVYEEEEQHQQHTFQ